MIFAHEPFETAIEEMMPLLHEHHNEIEIDNVFLDLDVDKARYIELCNAGFLKTFTVRSAFGHLIGYAVFFIQHNLHYKASLHATIDVIYLKPEYRGGNGSKFIAWCDEELKKMGVQVVIHAVSLKYDFSSMLERMGYKWVDKIYARRLDI